LKQINRHYKNTFLVVTISYYVTKPEDSIKNINWSINFFRETFWLRLMSWTLRGFIPI